MSQVSGAMTNLVYRCTTPGPTSENASVIVRVFGSGGKLFSQKVRPRGGSAQGCCQARRRFGGLLCAEQAGWSPCPAQAATSVGQSLSLHPPSCILVSSSLLAGICTREQAASPPLPPAQDERNIFLLASQLGVGPRCLVEFANGRVEEFLPGENLSSASMRRADVSAAIAAAMAAFHVRMLARLPVAQHASSGDGGAAGAAGALRPAIYDRIRRWHAAAAELCSAELAQVGLTNVPVEARPAAGLQGCNESWGRPKRRVQFA